MKTMHSIESAVEIPVGDQTVRGNLTIPQGAQSIVLFAHGSGSSRFSPRNKYVANMLHEANIATLLIDLLTLQEENVDEATGQFRFDVDLLAQRLVEVTNWLKSKPATENLRLGFFGASTGAAAALIAAAKLLDEVKAVVSRGGRPDLAGEHLEKVRAPTLLIVGGNDPEVLELNQDALKAIRTEKDLQIIPGASHLFEEPGTLREAAILAREWFAKHLPA